VLRYRQLDPDKFRMMLDDPANAYVLYENKSYLPRFFLAPTAKTYTDRKTINDAIRLRSENILNTLLIYDDAKAAKPQAYPASCISGPQNTVQVVSYLPNRIELKTDAACDAYLGSSEVMYPGWHAQIDGIPVKIYEADLAFRSVMVPKGNHSIVFWFRPAIFAVGALVSVITMIILVSVLIFPRKKLMPID
jgi:hypothetical protein